MGLIYDKNTGFYNLEEYIDLSFLDWDTTDPTKNSKYTVSFLNEALGGISSKSELVVIGADSGIGKTELVNSLAFENAPDKEVYLFSLEGDRYEVINRQRYKEYIRMVNTCGLWDLYISYRDFVQGNIPEDKKDRIRDEILSLDEIFKRKYKNLKIYSREESLNIQLFEAHLEMISDSADLVIIDHLHYFDFQSRDEYSAINDTMKKLKALQDRFRVPIVLVSHLRKKDKLRVFPDQNDFHGSSNIVKQADTVIVLAHVEPQDDEGNGQYEKQVMTEKYQTGIRVCKSRTGFPTRLLGLVDFDMKTREYAADYKLAVCGNNYVTMMSENEYPPWSRYYGKYTPRKSQGNVPDNKLPYRDS